MFRHSQCQLTCLELRYLVLAHINFVPLLAELTTLVELDIGLARDEEGLPKVAKSTLLPKLEILRLAGPIPFAASAFVDMVESRWATNQSTSGERGVSRIRHISLRYHREWDAQSISRLDKYRRDGLCVFAQIIPKID
jgi:hypothetical protein